MDLITPQQQGKILRDLFAPQDGYERLLADLRGCWRWRRPAVESIREGFITPPLTDEHRQRIDETLNILGTRQAEVVRKYYGIGCEPQTLEEIHVQLNLSTERVRQIKRAAMDHLRHPSRRKNLEVIPSEWASLKDELIALRQQADEADSAAVWAKLMLGQAQDELALAQSELHEWRGMVKDLGLADIDPKSLRGDKARLRDLKEQMRNLKEQEGMIRLLRKPVEELQLSVRSAHCLRSAGVVTLWDLVRKTELELLKYRNFGRKSLNELNAVLENIGLRLGMDVSQYRQNMGRYMRYME